MIRELVTSFVRRTGFSLDAYEELKSYYKSGMYSEQLMLSTMLIRIEISMSERELAHRLNTCWLMYHIERISLELSKSKGSSSILSSSLNEVVSAVEFELRRYYK